MKTNTRLPDLPCVSLFLFFFAVVIFAMARPHSALAADIVSVASGSGEGSLPYVISNAAADSTITFASGLGTITVSSSITIDKNLTISGPADETLAINTDSSNRVFTINNSAAVKIENLTFSGCGSNTTDGGVISLSASADLDVDNCTFSSNKGSNGGVIYASYAGTMDISNCNFLSNSAPSGSAIVSSNSNLAITTTTFHSNVSNGTESTGVIKFSSGTFTITKCSFMYNNSNSDDPDNDSYTSDGTVLSVSSATLKIINSNFSYNSNDFFDTKGTIFTISSDLTVYNTTIANNTMPGPGSQSGAFYAFDSKFSLINSTLYNNTASYFSEICSYAGSTYNKVYIYSSTIIEASETNSASELVSFEAQTIVIANSVIANNNGTTDIDCYRCDLTLAGGNFYGTISTTYSSVTGEDNSGYTATELRLDSFTTLSDSWAGLQVLIPESYSDTVDAGVDLTELSTDADIADLLLEDVRGVARPQQNGWDAGAVELTDFKVGSSSVSNVTSSGATVVFSVTDSDTSLTATGVCFNTDSATDPADKGVCKSTTPDPGKTSFSFTLAELAAETKYYLKAYATDASANVYGELLHFTTKAANNDDDDNDDNGDNGDNDDDGDNGDDGNNDGGSTLDDTLLLWRNTDNHKLAYWRLNSDGVLDTATDGSNGLVSDTQTLSDSWAIENVLQAGDYKVLLLRSTVSGLVACWRLNSDGSLTNNMEVVSSDAMLSSDWQLAGSAVINDAPLLFWQKHDTTRLVVWRLSSDCALQDSTRGSGWDEVAPDLDVRDNWQALGVLVQNDLPVVIWRNANNNRIAYWRLTADGLLAEADENDTWGWVNDTGLSTSWSLTDALTVNDTPTLFWHNETSGKVAYWRLNNQSVLQNTQQSDGWGFVYEGKVNTAWNLVGAFSLFDTPALLWHNRDSGRVTVWKLNDSATLDSIQTAYENGLATNWTLFGESD